MSYIKQLYCVLLAYLPSSKAKRTVLLDQAGIFK